MCSNGFRPNGVEWMIEMMDEQNFGGGRGPTRRRSNGLSDSIGPLIKNAICEEEGWIKSG